MANVKGMPLAAVKEQQVMTWGQFKRYIDALITDDGVVASIDWEQEPKLRITHLSAGIAISGAQK